MQKNNHIWQDKNKVQIQYNFSTNSRQIKYEFSAKCNRLKQQKNNLVIELPKKKQSRKARTKILVQEHKKMLTKVDVFDVSVKLPVGIKLC